MCGIAGVHLHGEDPPPRWEEVERMLSTVSHRGPDGWGVYRDDTVGLGHVRLSIIDPEGGAQPMGNEDGSVWIVYNGEVFNYVELRAELERSGARFRTSSDTEVVLRAYEAWGDSAWRRFNGQFALAVRDRSKERLWLVRDRMGIVPLFVAEVPGAVVFGSEIKAILAGGRIRPDFSGAGLRQIFTAWAPVAPHTAFAGVESVPPGTALCVEDGGGRVARRYWKPVFRPDPDLSFDAAVEELAGRLDRAISLRLRSDAPVGAYLSGGLDSSLVTRRLERIRGGGYASYSLRFSDARYDEGAAQKIMTERLESRHTEVLVDGSDIADALPQVVWHAEMPLLRTSPVPLFHLARRAREGGTRVVLTGEGADELLAGYQIFQEASLRAFWSREPDSERRPALFDRLYPYLAKEDGTPPEIWRTFFRRGLTDRSDPWYSHRVRWSNTGWTRRFLAPRLRSGPDHELERAIDARMAPGWRKWDLLSRAQALEMEVFMGGYLLAAQGDRVSMAHGLEARYPFLDPGVVELCLRMPRTHRLRALSDKRVLRAVASGELPAAIRERGKQPYRAPIAPALFRPDGPAWISELLEPRALEATGLFSPGAARIVEKARARGGRIASEREEMALVGILTLALLHRLFVVDLDARVAVAGDAFRTRGPGRRIDASASGPAAAAEGWSGSSPALATRGAR